MDVSTLRNYGVAFSDAESSWSAELKARMRRDARRVVLRHLSGWQRLRLIIAFVRHRRRARALDLSDLRARGLTNAGFVDQQLEYLTLFAALAEVLGSERAVEVMDAVMVETAHEPLLQVLPEPDRVRALGDPLDVFRRYLAVAPEAACAAGSQTLSITDEPDAIAMDVTWCVWLELARRVGVPEACLPNCTADELVFPEYFAALGIRYSRTGTLAGGASCCDFRFERVDGA